MTPFNAVYENPTEFSERIARNQQLLLKEESHFDKVEDPSAGSYFIEELTHSLADAAWKLFLKIENEGGFLEAVKAGTVQDDINATNDKRHADAAKRKEFILGTNQFPYLFSSFDTYCYDKGDDTLIMNIYYYRFQREEIIRNILFLGHYVKILSPKDITDEVIASIKNAYDQYQ